MSEPGGSGYVALDLLFKPRLPEQDVEIEGLGTVRVRGLSRIEALEMKDVQGVKATEVAMLVMGMVSPKVTRADVERWQRASTAGEIEAVSRAIGELSGMLESSAKDTVREFEADPDAEFRALPSSETVDDGGPAADGDDAG